MQTVWRIELLGGFQATSDSVAISRFRTRRVALLLAYLAFFQDRSHSREELAYLLWPDEEEEVARRNLRQALSTLRRHLEPPPLPAGSVLLVVQSSVQLARSIVSTDVAEFANKFARAKKSQSRQEQIEILEEAVALYKGALLPGFYEDWVQTERQRLEDEYVYGLQTLIRLHGEEGEATRSIPYIHLALIKEPLNEELQTLLIRLYLETGRPATALKQFKEFEHLLQNELHVQPGPEASKLAEQAKREGGEVGDARAPIAPQPKPEPRAKWVPHVQIPVQLTQYYGRTHELQQTLAFLLNGEKRLVSLLGPAGAGKTRLSQEVGRRVAAEGDWNVWFVPLADVSDAATILDAVIDVVDSRKEGRLDPMERLRRRTRGAKNLIVLDNLEHILEGAAVVVAQILQEVPDANLLVTTRHSLKLEGEQEIELQPLSTPEPNEAQREQESLAELSAYPSVQLFVNRCQAIHPDYQLTVNNAHSISAICSKLEGLPLALEIAAGLSNAFTTSQLLQNLENRLEILKNRRRDATPRHRSLRAAIDYSYELLSPDLQRLFASLSVFRGGFTVAAAAEVAINESAQDSETSAGRRRRLEVCLRSLLDLQERSLVRADDTQEGPEARFRLLESFREFGREQLTQEEEEELQDRHADFYFAGLMSIVQVHGANTMESSLFLARERDNSLAALQTFFERERFSEAITMLEVMKHRRLGAMTREIETSYVRRIADHPKIDSVPVASRVSLLRMVANTGLAIGDYDLATESCSKALKLAEEAGSRDLIADAYGALAVAAGYAGANQQAYDYYVIALAHAEPANNAELAQKSYVGIGTHHWTNGHLEPARKAFLSAQKWAKARKARDYWLIDYNLARLSLDMGALDEAMTLAASSLRASKDAMDEFGVSMSLSMMSRYHWLKGNLAPAIDIAFDAMVKRRNAAINYWVLNSIQCYGFLLVDAGNLTAAATLLAATRTSLRIERELDKREYNAALEKAKAGLDEADFEAAWANGLAMNMEEAFDYAVSLH